MPTRKAVEVVKFVNFLCFTTKYQFMTIFFIDQLEITRFTIESNLSNLYLIHSQIILQTDLLSILMCFLLDSFCRVFNHQLHFSICSTVNFCSLFSLLYTCIHNYFVHRLIPCFLSHFKLTKNLWKNFMNYGK